MNQKNLVKYNNHKTCLAGFCWNPRVHTLIKSYDVDKTTKTDPRKIYELLHVIKTNQIAIIIDYQLM